MTRKKYTLHFNIGDQTIPVNFDVFIGGSKASEVPVTTAWPETYTGTITADKKGSMCFGSTTINFSCPAKEIASVIAKDGDLLVNKDLISFTENRNSQNEIIGVNVAYANDIDLTAKLLNVTVVAKMDPDYSSVWDRLVYLKNKFGA